MEEIVQKNTIQKIEFINSQLPGGLGQNLEQEREFFWKHIEEQITSPDIIEQNKLNSIYYMLNKYKKFYKFAEIQSKLIFQIFTELLFMRKDVLYDCSKRNLIIEIIMLVMKRIKKSEIYIDHNLVYEWVMTFYHSNLINSNNIKYDLTEDFQKQIGFIRKLRNFYVDSSVPDFWTIIQNYSTDPTLQLKLIFFFIKTSAKNQEEIFQDILEQLLDRAEIGQFSKNTLMILIINELISKNRELKWEKFEKTLYLMIQSYINQVASGKNPEQILNLEFYIEKGYGSLIPQLIVNLMPPSQHPRFEAYKGMLVRIFNLIYNGLTLNYGKHPLFISFSQFLGTITMLIYVRFLNCERKRELLKLQKDQSEDLTKLIEIDRKKQNITLKYFKNQYRFSDEVDEQEINILKKQIQKVKGDETNLLDREAFNFIYNFSLKCCNKLIYIKGGETINTWLVTLMFRIDKGIQDKIISSSIQMIKDETKKLNTSMASILTTNSFGLILYESSKSNQGMKITPQLTQWMFWSLEYLKRESIQLNITIIQGYEKIWQYIPFRSYDDLLQDYLKTYPENDESDFRNEYNEGLDEDSQYTMIDYINTLDEWNIQFYDYIIDNLHNLKLQATKLPDLSCLFNINNPFILYFSQQTKSTLKQFIDKFFTTLDSRTMLDNESTLKYIIECFALLEPEHLLKKGIDFVFWKLLKKRTSTEDKEKLKNGPYYFLIENSGQGDEVLQYEITQTNSTVILYYLRILQFIIKFNISYASEKQFKQIEILYLVSTLHSDKIVCQVGNNLIYFMLKSLLLVYPKSIEYMDKKLKETDHKKRIFYLKHLYRLQYKDFEASIYEPGEKEKKIAFSMVNRYLIPTINKLNDIYLKNMKIMDFKKNYTELYDILIINTKTVDLNIEELNVFVRLNYIILSCFAGINLRVPFNQFEEIEKIEVYDKFQQSLFFKEFKGIRGQIEDFLLKSISLFFQKNWTENKDLKEIYLQLYEEMQGFDTTLIHNQKLFEGLKKNSKTDSTHSLHQFDTRIQLSFYIQYKYYQKIQFYFSVFGNKYQNQDQVMTCVMLLHLKSGMCNEYPYFQNAQIYQERKLKKHEIHKERFQYLVSQLDGKNENSYIQKLQKADENQKAMYQHAIKRISEKVISLKKYIKVSCCQNDPIILENFFKLLDFYEDLPNDCIIRTLYPQIIYEIMGQSKIEKYAYRNWLQRSPFLLRQKLYEIQKQHHDCPNQYVFDEDKINEENAEKEEKDSLKYINNVLPSQETSERIQNLLNQKHNIPQLELVSETKYNEIKQMAFKMVEETVAYMKQENCSWKLIIIKLQSCFSQLPLFAIDFYNGKFYEQQYNSQILYDLFEEICKLCISQKNVILSSVGKSGVLHFLLAFKRYSKEYVERNSKKVCPRCTMKKLQNLEDSVYERTFEEFMTFQISDFKNSDILLKTKKGSVVKITRNYDEKLVQILRKYFLDKDFLNTFLEKQYANKDITTDKVCLTIVHPSYLESIFANNYAHHQRTLKDYFVIQGTHQVCQNPNNLFYFKLFQFLKQDFVEASFEIFKNIIKEERQERQQILQFYLQGLLKWCFNIQDEQERLQVMEKGVQIFKQYIEEASEEHFNIIFKGLVRAINAQDFRVISPFFDQLVQISKGCTGQGKKYRFQKVYSSIIAYYGFQGRKYALEYLKNMNILEIEESHITEYIQILTIIIYYIMFIPYSRKRLDKFSDKLGLKYEVLIDQGIISPISESYYIRTFEEVQPVLKAFEQDINKIEDEKLKNKLILASYDHFRNLSSKNQIPDQLLDIYKNSFKNLLNFQLKDKVIAQRSVNTIITTVIISEKSFQEMMGIIETSLNSPNSHITTKEKALKYGLLYSFYYSQRENKIYLPQYLINTMRSENKDLANMSFQYITNILKLANQNEIIEYYQQNKELVKKKLPKEKNEEYENLLKEKEIALYMVMAILLTQSFDVYEYTEEALQLVLQFRKLTPQSKKLAEEFITKYWLDKKKEEFQLTQSVQLSSQIIEQLNSNQKTYSYFC